ncbi:MAG: DUF2892 domain-containing protein [Bacteroidia bacterium]|nr:DUF2892 domain-containing protein [Bacteroidia bacterium]
MVGRSDTKIIVDICLKTTFIILALCNIAGNMDKNVGRLDQVLRIILGLCLIWAGLFPMNGLQLSIPGIFISLISLIPFWMAITRKCPVFKFFNISTIPRNKRHE